MYQYKFRILGFYMVHRYKRREEFSLMNQVGYKEMSQRLATFSCTVKCWSHARVQFGAVQLWWPTCNHPAPFSISFRERYLRPLPSDS